MKFCGCTGWRDVEMAIEAGADAVGLIFAPSPRRIAWKDAVDVARRLPASIETVAVFVDPARREIDDVAALLPNATLQFSGNEPAAFVNAFENRAIKAIHVRDGDDAANVARSAERFVQARLLFDTYRDGHAGGTGETFAWDRVAAISRARPIVIAGGLHPDNVGSCVAAVRPFGVDVRSGVESGGSKDLAKMRAFVRAVRDADAP